MLVRRQVGIVSGMRRVDAAVPEVEREAPLLRRDDGGETCSAGEVGVGSGGSGGVEGKGEEGEQEDEETGNVEW
jgi:hypothetical protein